jgi:uncharacterized phage-associated protein
MVPEIPGFRQKPVSPERTEQAVINLAGWICTHYPYKDALTHLKLQKLLFYCYGALLAHDLEEQVGAQIVFEPWEHGPVNRDLYRAFRNQGSAPILPKDCPTPGVYSKSAERVMKDALTVYGVLSAWSLREQTHLEDPWKIAYENKSSEIDPEALKAYFKQKFARGSVSAPEYLFGLSSFKIDDIPVQDYPNLHALAKAAARVFIDKTKDI